MKNFMLPGLQEKFSLNQKFIIYFNKHREYFHDDINLYCAYGSFPISIWDGGRVFSEYHQASKEDILAAKSFYNQYNIKIRLVCTNPVLEEKHLSNTWMNLVCQLCEENGEIVINSPLLEEYIKDKYPGFNIISSTTKCLSNFDDLNKELENTNYHMVCLDYNLNKQIDKLKTIQNKEKCEFLVNPICNPGCPNRKNHYKLNGISLMNYGKTYSIDCYLPCNQLDPKLQKNATFITPEAIQEIYEPMGFSNFKLEGRTFDDCLLLGNYVYYMVKPEYQLLVFSDIFRNRL